MPRLGNRHVYDLLAVADELAARPGRTPERQAAFRGAVSTAYYAVFHALCFVCADELVGFGETNLMEPIYRSLDHGGVRKQLESESASIFSPTFPKLGRIFAQLQKERHDVDYRPPLILVKDRQQAVFWVGLAREAIALVEEFTVDERRALAVLLIARPRSGPGSK